VANEDKKGNILLLSFEREGMAEFEPFEGWKPVNPLRAVLLLVDPQYATGSRDMGMGKRWAELGMSELIEYRFGRLEKLVIPNIQRLLKFFRDNKLKVLYITYGSELPDYSDLPFHVKRVAEPAHNREGFREHEILDEVKPLAGEAVINKTTMGAFASTGIDSLLRAWGAEFLLFTGVSTYACVESTARDAADRGYKCILLADALAGSSKSLHEATLQNFSRLFGRVDTVDTILDEMRTQLLQAKAASSLG